MFQVKLRGFIYTALMGHSTVILTDRGFFILISLSTFILTGFTVLLDLVLVFYFNGSLVHVGVLLRC